MTVSNMNTLVIETVLTLSDQESIEIQHTPCKEQEKRVDEKIPGLIVMDSPNSTAPPTPSESFYNTSEIESLQNEMKNHDINEKNNDCDCLFPPLTTTTSSSSLNENLQDDSIIKSKQEQGANKNSGKIEEYTDPDIANEATSVLPSDESQNIDETKVNNNDSNDDDDDSVVLGPVEFFRKSIVAVTGTAMLGVGAVLVPAPVPLGIPVIAGGLALLSTEFPESVDKITETTRQKLVDVLEKDADKDDEEEHENNQVSKEDNDSSLKSSSKETTPANNNDNATFQENFNKTKRDIQKNVRNKLLPWLRKDSPKQEVSSLSETNSTTNEGN